MKMSKYNVLAVIAGVSVSMAATALEQGIGAYRLHDLFKAIFFPIVSRAEVAGMKNDNIENVGSHPDSRRGQLSFRRRARGRVVRYGREFPLVPLRTAGGRNN